MDGLPLRPWAGKDSGGQLLGRGGLQPSYQNAGILLIILRWHLGKLDMNSPVFSNFWKSKIICIKLCG